MTSNIERFENNFIKPELSDEMAAQIETILNGLRKDHNAYGETVEKVANDITSRLEEAGYIEIWNTSELSYTLTSVLGLAYLNYNQYWVDVVNRSLSDTAKTFPYLLLQMEEARSDVTGVFEPVRHMLILEFLRETIERDAKCN